MSGKLTGRTALITGASKGLGKAMALALAAEGARVGLVSRDAALLDGVAAEICKAGGRADVFRADVTSEEQVRAVEQRVAAEYGKVNILINNAGINVR
ncbi:MAG TPA: SDR family NAD(P)-dependent oxidoreductase, partial [Bryobacteraceae bacterium]|nr:SDR family NAD(P)-dependent oxidoreductase [Bryobacteraceae bacterium]